MELEVSVKLKMGDGESAPETTISSYNLTVKCDDSRIYSSIVTEIVKLTENIEL